LATIRPLAQGALYHEDASQLMRLVCPECSAAYDAPDTLFSQSRDVRCNRCGFQWTVVASPAAPPAVVGLTSGTVPAERATEPAPVQVEPVFVPTAPVRVEAAPVGSGVVKTEPVRTEPVRTEPVRAEPVKTGVIKAGVIKAGDIKTGGVALGQIEIAKMRPEDLARERSRKSSDKADSRTAGPSLRPEIAEAPLERVVTDRRDPAPAGLRAAAAAPRLATPTGTSTRRLFSETAESGNPRGPDAEERLLSAELDYRSPNRSSGGWVPVVLLLAVILAAVAAVILCKQQIVTALPALAGLYTAVGF
jgi:predicted Zn finger-like uncharacterized protein